MLSFIVKQYSILTTKIKLKQYPQCPHAKTINDHICALHAACFPLIQYIISHLIVLQLRDVQYVGPLVHGQIGP